MDIVEAFVVVGASASRQGGGANRGRRYAGTALASQ